MRVLLASIGAHRRSNSLTARIMPCEVAPRPSVLPSCRLCPHFTRSLSFDGLVGGFVTRRYTSGKLFRDAEGASHGVKD